MNEFKDKAVSLANEAEKILQDAEEVYDLAGKRLSFLNLETHFILLS